MKWFDRRWFGETEDELRAKQDAYRAQVSEVMAEWAAHEEDMENRFLEVERKVNIMWQFYRPEGRE